LPEFRSSSVVRRLAAIAALVMVSLFVCLAATAQKGPVQRSVQGKVYGSHSEPLPSAIVYLKNLKTNDIKSFIATQDGSYRFGQLSPDIDYEVWADLKGKKSSTKTLSSFDTKKIFYVDLHIDTK
jgi:hypothetical protein